MLRHAALILALLSAASAPAQRIQWARQFGTSAVDHGNAAAYGEFGAYVAGDTVGTFTGQPPAQRQDAFVSLHDTAGNLKWVRTIASTNGAEEVATGVAADGSGAYAVGYTRGILPGQNSAGNADSFLRKYGPDGDVLFTTQFGAASDDFANAVAAHTSGVYVAGVVDCCGSSFPGLPPTLGSDAYLRKFGGDGNVLWTRMISTGDTERATAVAVDSSGVYVAGTTNGSLAAPAGQRDGFIRKFSHDGAVLWTRQFGLTGANNVPTNEDVFAIAAGGGAVYVAGSAAQGSLPGSPFAGGLWDGFVAKYDANNVFQWARQIGTNGDDYPYAVAVGAGHVLVTGSTSGNLVEAAFAGSDDAFFRLYDFDGNVLNTQQFGNGSNDSANGAVAAPEGFYVSGSKSGISLNLTAIGDSDAFLLRLTPPPFIAPGGILNAASFAPSPAPLAPGSLAVLFGAYLNDGPQALATSLGPDGKLVTSLGGTQVSINNIDAPIVYSIATQVSVQIPFETAGSSTASVTVTVGGQRSSPRTINIAPAAPGFFTYNQQGTGEAIALHQDGVSLVNTQSPARRGEIIVFYLTGLGVLTPALATGLPAAANTAPPVTVSFGAAAAVVEYAGAAPGFVGLNQLNVRIPAGAPLGNGVPVSIDAGGRSANPVTISINQ